jgi:hypothetical protein
MAHVQSGKPAKETSTPAYQLKQCKRMNEAGAAQCREHLCATTARNEPECKQQPVAVKTAPNHEHGTDRTGHHSPGAVFQRHPFV